MHIFVTGACGYKGTVLVPRLLKSGHRVTALDVMWFGNQLDEHANLTVVKGDVMASRDLDFSDVDVIVHLASVANDPCGDLNPKLTWETSALGTLCLLNKAKRDNVPRFIYASSGSVYGIKSEEHVTEDLELIPISEYNKTKMVAERVVLSFADYMNVQIVRPATVCGLSPRMRLDVAVNLLTMQALSKGKITVLGGDQIRPNIHIEDMISLYEFMIENPNINGIFNAGFENISIKKIAKMVSSATGAEIIFESSNDPRSYRLDSTKISDAGFRPVKSVSHAIQEITEAYKAGLIEDSNMCYNLKWMQKNSLAGV